MVGAPGAVFTRLSDQEALVQLPASVPAGTYPVTTPNALGVTPPSTQVQLTAPVATGRVVLPGNGASGHLLWDGLRDALLVLEPPSSPSLEYSNLLRRHVLRDGAWTTTSKNVLMLRRIGFSPDGAQLLAIAEASGYAGRDGRGFLEYDPVKLDVVSRYSYPNYAPEPPSQAALAVTYDGWAWFGSAYGALAFDPANRYRQWGFPVPGSGYYPAHTLASRDGSRLLVSRPYAVACGYHDASERLSDSVFHPIAARLSTFDAVSDDAGRVLSGTNVYDHDFALVGTLPAAAILSGDGRRAFTLENRGSAAGSPAPLVHVFDLTTPVEGGGPLPELGTVGLLDHDTCATGERTCAPTSSLAVTPDGRVLFAQTAGGVVVVPIPDALLAP